MLLAPPSTFTQAHYEAHKGVAPAQLCELVVHCLELVAQLSKSGLVFRFKGGNSLLVLLESPQRFSIDVDVVTTMTKEALIDEVGKIVERCDVFTRFEHRAPRTKPWLPMIGFKLYFDSVYPDAKVLASDPPGAPYVMLDCVLEPPPYGGVTKPVKCLDLYACEERVEVPSVSGLIGDKLLTIGPRTLGIPLGKGKDAQRLKHVFDVSLLSRQPYDLAEVHASIVGCMAQENRIQGRSCSYEETADDTRRFLDAAIAHENKPDLASLSEGTDLFEIVKGFDGFRPHLFRVDYTWAAFLDDCRRVRSFFDRIGAP